MRPWSPIHRGFGSLRISRRRRCCGVHLPGLVRAWEGQESRKARKGTRRSWRVRLLQNAAIVPQSLAWMLPFGKGLKPLIQWQVQQQNGRAGSVSVLKISGARMGTSENHGAFPKDGKLKYHPGSKLRPAKVIACPCPPMVQLKCAATS